MNIKKAARMRRAKRSRIKMREIGAVRLCVNRTPRHIYAQIIDSDGGKIIASASTLDKDFTGSSTGNSEAAKLIGTLIAAKAKKAGVTKVAFDRSGFKYHGRVEALANAAREAGLDF